MTKRLSNENNKEEPQEKQQKQNTDYLKGVLGAVYATKLTLHGKITWEQVDGSELPQNGKEFAQFFVKHFKHALVHHYGSYEVQVIMTAFALYNHLHSMKQIMADIQMLILSDKEIDGDSGKMMVKILKKPMVSVDFQPSDHLSTGTVKEHNIHDYLKWASTQ